MSNRSRNSDNFESVSSRRNIFVAMFIAVTICTTVYIVLSRLSNDALSLLIGLVIGGSLICVPFAAVLYLYLKSLNTRQERRENYNPQPYIIQLPSQPAQPALTDNTMQWNINHERRQVARDWDILGNSDNE